MSAIQHLDATGVEQSAAVEVDDLAVMVRRNGASIVEGVSFTIRAGEILGLVGESGSGKTTAGLALLGYVRDGLRIARGRVEVGGTDILKLSGEQLRSARGRLVSYVPQDPASGLNPTIRIRNQLREALTVHGQTDDLDARIAALLAEVHLDGGGDLLRKYPHQLSGGQQQRIGLAMAFACRPRLVVLDEPTTGLDVTTQRHVLDTIRQLALSHGVASVYVSHDLPAVTQIADYTAVMYAGRVVELGPTHQLFARPRHRYTRGLVASAPDPDERCALVGIEGQPPSPGEWPNGCGFADRCDAVDDQCRHSTPLLQVAPSHVSRCVHPPASATVARIPVELRAPGAGPVGHLEVRDLSALYGAHQVLESVALTVRPGQCTAVVGESGSGKTTLSRCLIGLHERWTGAVQFEGDQLSPRAAARTRAQRQRMQYVFQNPYSSLNPRMTIEENIEEPLRHFTDLDRDARRDRAMQSLADVALPPRFANRLPAELSGGERQRAAIGRALVVDPSLLICDEVTSALDVSVQALIVEQLRALQRERDLTMVFVTHNLAVVRSIADDVVVLNGGRVVESGPAEQVLSQPTDPYTQSLLADLPRLS